MYLELSDLHDFFRQCLLYNKLVGKLKKSRLFPPSGPPSTSTTATWWSPTSEFVIKVNLTYYTCFMPNFSQGIHLDESQTYQTLKGVSKVFAVKKNSIISKNIYIFQLISQENNPWLPKQLGSCQAWRKIDFGESQLRFSSMQFSKSSPVPELSRADPSPHQPYLRE